MRMVGPAGATCTHALAVVDPHLVEQIWERIISHTHTHTSRSPNAWPHTYTDNHAAAGAAPGLAMGRPGAPGIM
jgi:hypothetical protein